MSSPVPLSKVYKRNQVEGVLWALLSGPGRTARERLGKEPAPYFRARLKRLIDTDVRLRRALDPKLGEYQMAFFDELPKGKGTDSRYEPNKVLNLAIGLELVRFGCKPQEVVETLSEQRQILSTVFVEINKKIATRGRHRANKLDEGEDQRPAKFLVFRHIEAPNAMDLPGSGHVAEGETFLNVEIASSREDLHRFIDQTIPSETTQLLVMEVAEMSARITELLEEVPSRPRGTKAAVDRNSDLHSN